MFVMYFIYVTSVMLVIFLIFVLMVTYERVCQTLYIYNFHEIYIVSDVGQICGKFVMILLFFTFIMIMLFVM